MPPANQQCQRDLAELLGSEVKYVEDPDAGHDYADDVPAQAISWVYGNIPGSGVNKDDELLPADDNWSEGGKLVKFD